MNCATRLSALAASITGNCKDLLSTLVGFVVFPDSNLSADGAVGFVLSFLGVWTFGYFKLQEQKAAAAAAAAQQKVARSE